jgi:hypothetical protein
VYFLMARIDLTGGSTGWHRAQLIRSATEHLAEWWAVGTDYTRHWMPTGIHANEFHTDITNHFLEMGVWGGLPLLICFVLILSAAFRAVGTALRQHEGLSPRQGFLIWTIGVMLFGQVMTFWSISLFDQSVSFFYLVLATIGAVQLPVAMVAEQNLARSTAPGKTEWRSLKARPCVARGRRDGVAAVSGRPAGVGGRWPRHSLSIEPGGRGRMGNRR